MALKQRHKTGKKGDKRHNDGLNTKTDMAYYVKCEMTEFEIQTRDICPPAPPPPPSVRGPLLPVRPPLHIQEADKP